MELAVKIVGRKYGESIGPSIGVQEPEMLGGGEGRSAG